MKIFAIILMLRKIYVSQKYRVFFSKITTHVYHKLTLKKTNNHFSFYIYARIIPNWVKHGYCKHRKLEHVQVVGPESVETYCLLS